MLGARTFDLFYRIRNPWQREVTYAAPRTGRPETSWNHKGDAAVPGDLITDPTEERLELIRLCSLNTVRLLKPPPRPDTQPF